MLSSDAVCDSGCGSTYESALKTRQLSPIVYEIQHRCEKAGLARVAASRASLVAEMSRRRSRHDCASRNDVLISRVNSERLSRALLMKSRDDDAVTGEGESSTTKVGLGSRWRTGSRGQSSNELSVDFGRLILCSSSATACMSEDMSVSGIDNRRIASPAWCCHGHIIHNAGTAQSVT